MDSQPLHVSTWPISGQSSGHPMSLDVEALTGDNTAENHSLHSDPDRSRSPEQQPWEAVGVPAGYPSINHRPVLLKTSVLCTTATIFFLAMMALAAVAWTADSSRAYRVDNVNYFLVLRYGPAALGAVSQLLFQQIITQFLRMLPFVNMASPGRPKDARNTIMARWWPVMHDWGNPVVIILGILLFLTAYLISFKIFLIEIVEQEGYWATYVHPVTAWCLTGYYGAIFLATVWITVLLALNQTGIRLDWDPECIADYISLFRHFNVLPPGEKGGLLPSMPKDFRDCKFRLGYWRRMNGTSEEIAYGIRGIFEDGASSASFRPASDRALRLDRGIRVWKNDMAKHVRKRVSYPYRFPPFWALQTWLFLLALPAILGLLCATAGTGYLKHGFVIDDRLSLIRLDQASARGINVTSGMANLTITNEKNFIAWGLQDDWRSTRLLLVNFVLRAAPMIMLLSTLNGLTLMDLAYRSYRPVHNLTAKPCSATDSLLMDYLTRSPFAVTADALSKGYGKVFVLSIMGSAAPALAIIPFGIMTLTSTVDGNIIGKFSMASFVGTVILALAISGCYLMVFPFVPWRHHDLVPWKWYSPIDIWQTFHASDLAKLPEFGRCEETWTKDHLRAALITRNQKYRIGVSARRGGNELIGADIFCDEQNVPTGLVDGVRPRHRRFARWVPGLFKTELDVKNAEEIPLADRQTARTVDQTN